MDNIANLEYRDCQHPRPVPSDELIGMVVDLKMDSTALARDRIVKLEPIYELLSNEQFPNGAYGSGAGGCSEAQMGTKYRKQRKFKQLLTAVTTRTSGKVCESN